MNTSVASKKLNTISELRAALETAKTIFVWSNVGRGSYVEVRQQQALDMIDDYLDDATPDDLKIKLSFFGMVYERIVHFG